MLLTDETASATATLAYSAFGEPVGDPAALATRYQFAGGHGYESGLLTLPAAPGTVPLTFQHLGARWYQPNTGRFIQRDPIGLAGGMNVYAYCANNPAASADPNGLRVWTEVKGSRTIYVVIGQNEKGYKIFGAQKQALLVTYDDGGAGGDALMGSALGLAFSVVALCIPEPVSTLAGGCGVAASGGAVIAGVTATYFPTELSRKWVDVGSPTRLPTK